SAVLSLDYQASLYPLGLPLHRFEAVIALHDLFFFQAEDGIRDRNVTGVQTCALPICNGAGDVGALAGGLQGGDLVVPHGDHDGRSEERRVGKEWRSRSGRGDSIKGDACRRGEERAQGDEWSSESRPPGKVDEQQGYTS